MIRPVYMNAVMLTFLGVSVSTAATVNMDDYTTDTWISQTEFENAQNAAGSGGTILFSATYYKINEMLKVTKPWMKLIGADKNSTYITCFPRGDVQKYMIWTDQNGTKVQQMTVRGSVWPMYKNQLDLYEGTSVATGVEAAIHVASGARSVKAIDVRIVKASVGVEYDVGKLPDGLKITDTDFTTGRGMVNVHDSESKPAIQTALLNPIQIDNANFTYQAGQGARGITVDLGNSSEENSVDLNGSYIRNCSMEKVTNWQIDFNRTKDLEIYNNFLYGGGAGTVRTSYVHCLHFEDVSSDIYIHDNYFYQRDKNDAGVALSMNYHIVACGNNGYPTGVRLAKNEFAGSVSASVSGLLNNWTITDNEFNIDNSPTYLINGWKAPSTISRSGNTVNSAALSAAQVKINF